MRSSITIAFQLFFEYASRRVLKNQEVLELNATYQLLVYVENVDILGKTLIP
jgi:hypothetical protein